MKKPTWDVVGQAEAIARRAWEQAEARPAADTLSRPVRSLRLFSTGDESPIICSHCGQDDQWQYKPATDWFACAHGGIVVVVHSARVGFVEVVP
jgi:hypothetical protein